MNGLHIPVMQQYDAIRSQFPDTLLFYRMATRASSSTTTRATPRSSIDDWPRRARVSKRRQIAPLDSLLVF
jgi:hypothetical protein